MPKKYPIQRVNLEGLEQGLIIVYQGEKFKILGRLWHQIFSGIIDSIQQCREKCQRDDAILNEYEKQFSTGN